MSAEIPEQLLFPKEGHDSSVRILEKKRIGQGIFGVVSEVVTEVAYRGKTRKKLFAVKTYYDKNDAETCARKSLENYHLAKEAGLKVFPTYRLSKDGKKVLITLGHSEDWICFGGNLGSSSLEHFGKKRIENITNFAEFLPRYFREALKATEKGVRLHLDVFFFFLERKAKKESLIDFVLGDYDNLSFEINSSQSLFSFNTNEMFLALTLFFSDNFSSRKESDDYIHRARSFLEQFVEKNKERFSV